MAKKQSIKGENMAGRPTVITEEVVKKLLDAFSYSFTDEEACVYADISKKTLYNYCDKNPKFLHQKELLKKKPGLKAKMNLVGSINRGEVNDSKWYLERKGKDEFSTKQEIDQKSDIEIKAEISAIDKLNNLLGSE